jgi:hypothetical protein
MQQQTPTPTPDDDDPYSKTFKKNDWRTKRTNLGLFGEEEQT